MNLSVVAEGVETREQLERLRDIGCDYVQGYFFAKPMPDKEFEKLLQTQCPKNTAHAKEDLREKASMRKLLVADEDAGYRERVCQTFERQYQVVEASDAVEVLACVRETKHGPISAVILSMTLPNQGAETFLKTLRQDPALWRIPVLATISTDKNLETLALELDTDLPLQAPSAVRPAQAGAQAAESGILPGAGTGAAG